MTKHEEHEIKRINADLKTVQEQVDVLEQDPKVKEYMKLLNQRSLLLAKKEKIERERNDAMYMTCDHLFVRVDDGNEPHERRCVKCGLPMRKNTHTRVLTSNIVIEFGLAQRLYAKLKQENPESSDGLIAWKMKEALAQLKEAHPTEDSTIKK